MKFIIISICVIGIMANEINLNKYNLVWQDEFIGNELNTSKWNYRYLGKRKLAYNSKEAIKIIDGILKIKIYKKANKIYTGMISTDKKYEFKYGYFEIKAKVPYVKGIQSAFWLQSNYYGKFINYPDISGIEVDIMEYIYKNPKKIHFTIHWDGYKKYHKKIHKSIKYPKIIDGKWHTFGLLWSDKQYGFYIDRKLKYIINSPISHINEYIVLSTEITKWAGKLEENKLPAYFLIDYVRVFKRRDGK